MKKLIIPAGITLAALIIFVIGFIWWQQNSNAVSSDTSTKDYLIQKGQGAALIGQELHDAGLIKNAFAFKLYTQLTGKAGAIQAGEFRLSPSYSLTKTVNVLTSGPLELWVTVPEGLRREEIPDRFISALEMDTDQASTFRAEFLKASENLDGYLFPDTYLFPRTVTAGKVVAKMKATFDTKIADYQSQIDKSNLTLNQIVTLASILERETKTAEERPIVAGILMNRLNIGMALQADASVQYAIATAKCKPQDSTCEWWPILTRQDLDVESPFNTYKYTGLPPGPIANPGLTSLEAAISPASTDYFYYIHDSDGNIHYAKTLEEHNFNVRKYLGK